MAGFPAETFGDHSYSLTRPLVDRRRQSATRPRGRQAGAGWSGLGSCQHQLSSRPMISRTVFIVASAFAPARSPPSRSTEST